MKNSHEPHIRNDPKEPSVKSDGHRACYIPTGDKIPMRPWMDLTRIGLEASQVHDVIDQAMESFLNSVEWDDVGTAMIILRGGSLLRSSLSKRCNRVVQLQAQRSSNGVTIVDQPTLRSETGRLLICDVLCDTGATMWHTAQWVRGALPNAQIELFCVFSTEHALRRLSPIYPMHFLEIFGQSWWSARSPTDIPYDFGEVAAKCSLI